MYLLIIFSMSAILSILIIGGAWLYLSIHYKLNQIQIFMATFKEEVVVLLGEIDAATTATAESIETAIPVITEISEDQKFILDKLSQETISEEDRAEIITRLTSGRDKSAAVVAALTPQVEFLKQIAANVEQPVPEPPVEPSERVRR